MVRISGRVTAVPSGTITLSIPAGSGLRILLGVEGTCVMELRVWPGKPYPLGATWDGQGVNFALFSEHATRVELCLFNSPRTARNVTVSRFGNTQISSGMPICRRFDRGNCMDIEFTGRGIRGRATGSIPIKCCWIRMRVRSDGGLSGRIPCLDIRWVIRKRT